MDPTDPRAIRSRRDLRMIDALLGNSRWILSQLRRHGTRARNGIVEIGAGEGILCKKIDRALPFVRLTGLDFLARPNTLPVGIGWKQGDFRDSLAEIFLPDGHACVGSLILHHFSNLELSAIGSLLNRFSLLVFCEPLRGSLPVVYSSLLSPFVGKVTRHDMPSSILAGFRFGELPRLLGLDTKSWIIQESGSGRGSLRLLASRK